MPKLESHFQCLIWQEYSVLKRETGFDFEKGKLADTENDVVASRYRKKSIWLVDTLVYEKICWKTPRPLKFSFFTLYEREEIQNDIWCPLLPSLALLQCPSQASAHATQSPHITFYYHLPSWAYNHALGTHEPVAGTNKVAVRFNGESRQ